MNKPVGSLTENDVAQRLASLRQEIDGRRSRAKDLASGDDTLLLADILLLSIEAKHLKPDPKPKEQKIAPISKVMVGGI